MAIKKVRGSAGKMTGAGDIDSYIEKFPKSIQILLQRVRSTIRKAAPDAEEAIRYGIPTFILNGNLVHFGGFKSHIGFYPAPSGLRAFSQELSAYEGAKGSVRFPFDEPLPLATISKIVKFRVKENCEKPGKGKPKADFMGALPAPARRALENEGIRTLKQLAKCSEAQILDLHGMGPSSILKLKQALKQEGLAFKRK